MYVYINFKGHFCCVTLLKFLWALCIKYILYSRVCVCVPAAVFPVINKIDSQSVARWVFKAIQLFFGIKCWSKITVANQSMTWRHKTEQDESQAEYFKFKVRNEQLQHTDINYKLQLELLHFVFSCAYVKIKTGTLVSSQMENNMSLKQSPRL